MQFLWLIWDTYRISDHFFRKHPFWTQITLTENILFPIINYMMNEVKAFIDEYFKVEVKTEKLSRIPNIEAYNASISILHSFFIDEFDGLLGHVIVGSNKIIIPELYKKYEGIPAPRPRILFKISKYSHGKYKDVWIAYTSNENLNEESKILRVAFFIIKKNGKFKIAKKYAYSECSSNRRYYQWEERIGDKDLKFDALTEPVEIKRYIEPEDKLDSLKHYYANI